MKAYFFAKAYSILHRPTLSKIGFYNCIIERWWRVKRVPFSIFRVDPHTSHFSAGRSQDWVLPYIWSLEVAERGRG